MSQFDIVFQNPIRNAALREERNPRGIAVAVWIELLVEPNEVDEPQIGITYFSGGQT